MRGLIASVLGGVSRGVGEVAAGQIELNSRKALMEAEEEMRARLAEAAETRAETRQIAAEERDIKNIGRKAEEEDKVLARRFEAGSEYPGLLAQQIRAQETPGQKVYRERQQHLFDTEQRRQELVDTILTMSNDDPVLPALLRQLQILDGEQRSPTNPQQSAQIDYYQSRINQLERNRQDAIRDLGPDDPLVAEIEEELNSAQSEISKRLGLPSFSSGRDVPRITSDEEFDALPSGTVFLDPNGIRRTKP